jgi:hypothetical protein
LRTARRALCAGCWREQLGLPPAPAIHARAPHDSRTHTHARTRPPSPKRLAGRTQAPAAGAHQQGRAPGHHQRVSGGGRRRRPPRQRLPRTRLERRRAGLVWDARFGAGVRGRLTPAAHPPPTPTYPTQPTNKQTNPLPRAEHDEEVPGLGQHYCIPCRCARRGGSGSGSCSGSGSGSGTGAAGPALRGGAGAFRVVARRTNAPARPARAREPAPLPPPKQPLLLERQPPRHPREDQAPPPARQGAARRPPAPQPDGR